MKLSGLTAETGSWKEPIQDFLKWCRQKHRTAKTVGSYRYHLAQIERWAELEGVVFESFTRRHMRAFLDFRENHGGRLGKGCAEKTRREDVICAKAFFDFAVREEYIRTDPLRGFDVPSSDDPYVPAPSEEDLKLLLQAIDDRWKLRKNPKIRFCAEGAPRFFRTRDYAVIVTFIDTAAREDEVLGLLLDDYHPERKELHFRKTKSQEPRVVPITDFCIEALESWLRIRQKISTGCEYFFVNQYGGRLKQQTFGDSFRMYRDFAGLTHYIEVDKDGKKVQIVDRSRTFSIHGVRHYSGTQLAKADFYAAMMIMGHKDPRTTRRYLTRDADHVRQAQADAGALKKVLGTPGGEYEGDGSKRKGVVFKKK